jgi:hypothetical protein
MITAMRLPNLSRVGNQSYERQANGRKYPKKPVARPPYRGRHRAEVYRQRGAGTTDENREELNHFYGAREDVTPFFAGTSKYVPECRIASQGLPSTRTGLLQGPAVRFKFQGTFRGLTPYYLARRAEEAHIK